MAGRRLRRWVLLRLLVWCLGGIAAAVGRGARGTHADGCVPLAGRRQRREGQRRAAARAGGSTRVQLSQAGVHIGLQVGDGVVRPPQQAGAVLRRLQQVCGASRSRLAGAAAGGCLLGCRHPDGGQELLVEAAAKALVQLPQQPAHIGL